MGEQRPGDTINGFIDVGLPPDAHGSRAFYSRPDTITDSFEARRFVAPAEGLRPQTEFFEYHWAHLMQGNRLDDLWPTVRRLLLTSPRQVPSGLRLVWALSWLLIAYVAWALALGPLSWMSLTDFDTAEAVMRALLGGGVTATVISYLATRVLARGITKSFVDVVRYLDTSPRSYESRRNIRKGLVDLLTGLHERKLFGRPRYDRIIVVGHSLGAYIAHDGIGYLWGQMNGRNRRRDGGLDGLEEAEQAAARLPQQTRASAQQPVTTELRAFQIAQRRLWRGLRDLENPWRITDLVTVGTPMYFADRLIRGTQGFTTKVDRGELPVCPPITDPDPRTSPDPDAPPDPDALAEAMAVEHSVPRFTWRRNRRVLHESAPFAVVRWTNLWFPHRFGLGDWFGGPLARLFGDGIRDIEIRGNVSGRWGWLGGRLVPGVAHTRYFHFPDDTGPTSVTTALRNAIDLRLESFPDGDSDEEDAGDLSPPRQRMGIKQTPLA
jgi:hypothetical protein